MIIGDDDIRRSLLAIEGGDVGEAIQRLHLAACLFLGADASSNAWLVGS
jgi:hypothetical protein